MAVSRLELETSILESFVRGDHEDDGNTSLYSSEEPRKEERKTTKKGKGRNQHRKASQRSDTSSVGGQGPTSFSQLSKDLRLKNKQQEALAAALASRKMRRYHLPDSFYVPNISYFSLILSQKFLVIFCPTILF